MLWPKNLANAWRIVITLVMIGLTIIGIRESHREDAAVVLSVWAGWSFLVLIPEISSAIYLWVLSDRKERFYRSLPVAATGFFVFWFVLTVLMGLPNFFGIAIAALVAIFLVVISTNWGE